MLDLCAMELHPVRSLGPIAWNELNAWLLAHEGHFTSVHILVDSMTHELVLPQFMGELDALGDAHVLEIEPGEASKELAIIEQLALGLRDEGADRGALLIALGGGVVCDMAGLLANLYLRGIDLVLVPTSLLAMVDAAWGGKNGVDAEGTKNLLGTWRPEAPVFADVRALETLPEREWRQGWAELLKQAWIAGGSLWNEAVRHDYGYAGALMAEAAQVKLDVVAADPFERGSRRAVLNMGHTVGHAVESLALELDWDLGHGDAVAFGLSVESRILDGLALPGASAREALRSRINADFDHSAYRNLDPEAVWARMQHDKKKRGGQLRMVWSAEPGAPEAVWELDDAQFYAAWKADAKH
jgi:3-dehydroquinate synthetase